MRPNFKRYNMSEIEFVYQDLCLWVSGDKTANAGVRSAETRRENLERFGRFSVPAYWYTARALRVAKITPKRVYIYYPEGNGSTFVLDRETLETKGRAFPGMGVPSRYRRTCYLQPRRKGETLMRRGEFLTPEDIPDFYKPLGLVPPVSKDEVKQAFRDLVKRIHPDSGGSADEVIEINRAYDVALTRTVDYVKGDSNE